MTPTNEDDPADTADARDDDRRPQHPATQLSFATRPFCNGNGSFSGQSFTRGNSTSFSDGNGRFSGSSNGTTSFYDARGHFIGSSVN